LGEGVAKQSVDQGLSNEGLLDDEWVIFEGSEELAEASGLLRRTPHSLELGCEHPRGELDLPLDLERCRLSKVVFDLGHQSRSRNGFHERSLASGLMRKVDTLNRRLGGDALF
jgi:hypothetical protein